VSKKYLRINLIFIFFLNIKMMSDIRPMDIVGVIVVLIIIVACIYLFVIKKGRSEDEEEDYATPTTTPPRPTNLPSNFVYNANTKVWGPPPSTGPPKGQRS
jgi:hypothetical protein